MATDVAAPTRALSTGSPGAVPWATLSAQTKEKVPELRWPRSVGTYDSMTNDAQVYGLYAGTVLPLIEYRWWLDPNGVADEDALARLAEDVGLPVGEPAEDAPTPWRPEGRFDFGEHLQEALWSPIFGHYYFEQQGDTEAGWWRLHKLAPIHPSTVREVKTDDNGGLVYVKQTGASRRVLGGLGSLDAPEIPVSQLVGYIWWPTAVDRWLGRSILRPLWRNYLVKDVLIRVDATNHQRAGGVPYVRTDQTFAGGNLDALAKIAQQFGISEEAGGALPPGAWLEIARAMGGAPVIDSVRYHDEQMAQVWQGIVRMLGQTPNGSRALGDTLGDLEALARRSVAGWVSRVFTRHVIGDWWVWNVAGPVTSVPRLRYSPPVAEGLPDASAPVDPGEPAGGGESPPDPQPAAARRAPRPLDARAAPREPVPIGSRRVGGAGLPRVAAGALRLPDRPLRREPTAVEVAAAVDFAALEQAYNDAADELERLFSDEWLPTLVDDLRAQIEAGDVTAERLAQVRAAPVGAERMAELLADVAEGAAADAAAELAEQGADVPAATREALSAALADQAAAVAQQTADGLSLAASRRAVQLVGTGGAETIAGGVVDYLTGLEHRWERDQLAGAVQQAQNHGRLSTYEAVEQQVSAYSSELLDANTCGPCADEDGTEYRDLATARERYPSGGFVDCDGGPRCRGTVVVVVE